MPHQPGTLIADKIRLVRPLGAGGMGQVWLADHLTLETQVAVKVIAREHAANREAVARFRREAAAAAKIKCPQVVQILDFGVYEDKPFIVMELLEGEDLAQRIHRTGPLSISVVRDVVAQVCKALTRAHGLGIVHRDIKPENVFICEDHGERLIKVLDFGIAKRREDTDVSMTSTGVALGSPCYMSPEQVVSAKGVDPRSDLWSLGVVAYQALTDKLPFGGETVGALAIAINDGNYEPPSSLRSDIPKSIDGWFQRVLVKDLSARYQSAREMADAFERVIAEQPDTEAVPVINPRAAPTVVTRSRARTPDAAPGSGGTHMTATLQTAKRVASVPVLWGIAAGALVFIAVATIGIVATLRSTRDTDAALTSDRPALASPAAPASVATEPSAGLAPLVAPTREPSAAPAPSAAPTTPTARKPSAGTLKTAPVRKKDRGF